MTTLWSALPQFPQMKKIIYALELEPVNMNWKIWTDYQGNFLTWHNHNIKISYQNTPFPPVRDLYKKSDINKLLSISKKIAWKINNDTITLWLLCSDKTIKAVRFSNNSWSNTVPPLSLDFFALIHLLGSTEHYRVWNKYIFWKKNNLHVSPWPINDNNKYIEKLLNAIYKN